MERWLVLALLCASCGRPHGTTPYSPRPVDPVAIQRACAMEVSCLSPVPITTAGSCVSQFEAGLATGVGIFFGPSADDLQRYVDCTSTSADCSSALQCASHNHGPDWCNAHGQTSCDGDVLVGCESGWGLFLTDCTAFGMHCGTANGWSSCTDGNACDPTTMGAHCDGNRLIDCNSASGLEKALDCAALIPGGTCKQSVSSNSTSTGCVPPQSGSCATDGERCDGTTAVFCSSGVEQRIDCTELASHCAVDSTGKVDCVTDAMDCTSMSPDSCVGDALQLCVNGAWKQTSCSSIGFATCSTLSGQTACR